MKTLTCLNRIRMIGTAAVVITAPLATAGEHGMDTRMLARCLGLEAPRAHDEVMVVRPKTVRTGVRKTWIATKEESVSVYADSMATMPVLFEEGGTQIRRDHAASELTLGALAAVMRAHPAARFLIEGHTCDIGGERDNIELSWARAEAVKGRLMLLGIDPQRVTVLGFGEREAPKHFDRRDKSAATEAARQAYRRVVVRQLAE